MKSLIVTLISLASLTTFASRIPVCTMTFGGGPEGVGIFKPMQQEIRGSIVIYTYHFEKLHVDARFNLANGQTGLILMVDKTKDSVVSMTSASLIDAEDESIEAYLNLNDVTYQVDCKYADEVPESDKQETITPEPKAE